MILDNIRELSAKRKVSITELEKTLGLSNGTIGKWKDSSPKIENLRKVSEYFGVTIEELLA